jgi:hypothetical protein
LFSDLKGVNPVLRTREAIADVPKLSRLVALTTTFLIVAVTPAIADNIITTTSLGVDFSVYDGQFFVRSTPIPPGAFIPGLNASSDIEDSQFHLSAGGKGYTDAGIVLFFGGGLSLGAIQNITVASSGAPVKIKLWIDSGGDGKLFTFNDQPAPDDYSTGLNGDTYGGTNDDHVDENSLFYMFGGAGTGNQYTLGQLQSGAVAGINGDMATALWIGITNTSTDPSAVIANISQVDVTATPEPAGLLLLGGGLLLIGFFGRRRDRRN